jgi:hypothetical protein
VAAEVIAHPAGGMDRDIGTGMIGITSRDDIESMVTTGRGVIANTKTIGPTSLGDTHASTTRPLRSVSGANMKRLFALAALIMLLAIPSRSIAGCSEHHYEAECEDDSSCKWESKKSKVQSEGREHKLFIAQKRVLLRGQSLSVGHSAEGKQM